MKHIRKGSSLAKNTISLFEIRFYLGYLILYFLWRKLKKGDKLVIEKDISIQCHGTKTCFGISGDRNLSDNYEIKGQ